MLGALAAGPHLDGERLDSSTIIIIITEGSTTMATYAQRFTRALQDVLGERFTVEDSQGLTVATHADGGTMSYWLPAADKRKPVQDTDVREWLEIATRRTQGDLPHFTDTARAQAQSMLAELS